MHFPSPRYPDLNVREDKSNEREYLQAPVRRELFLDRKRRAGDRDEEVHGHRVWLELPQGERHVHYVVIGLAHPEERPRTRRETRNLGFVHGTAPVLVGVGRADIAVEVLAGIEVVVVSVDARAFQRLGLSLLEQPETGTDLQLRVPGSHLSHRTGEAFDLVGGRPTAARHKAQALRPALQRLLRPIQDLLRPQVRVFPDPGRRYFRLRAVFAVLRAEPTLYVDEGVELHPVAEELAAYFTNRPNQLHYMLLRVGEHEVRLLAREWTDPQSLLDYS